MQVIATMNPVRTFGRGFLPLALLCAAQAGSAAVRGPETDEAGAADQPAEPIPAMFTLVEHRWAARPAPVALLRADPPRVAEKPASTGWLRSIGRGRVLPWVRGAEGRHRLPFGLLDALIATESAYVAHAVSRAGAAGLAQLMPATAIELGVRDRFDPLQSIEGGARYLRRMLDRFGSVSLALAAYNAGPGAVLRAGGIPANRETPGYVGRVIARWSAAMREPL